MENIAQSAKSPTSNIWACAVFGLVLVFALKSCFFNELSAEDTIKKNIIYISKGKAVEALALMKNETLDIEGITTSMVESSKVMSAKGGVSDVAVKSPGDGTEGIYAATIKYGNGETEGPMFIRMERDGSGVWKIAQTRRASN